MSTIIDNITLTLVSLKQELEEYLDGNLWRNKYSIYIAGDPNLRGKELVKSVKSRQTEIALPVITLNTGLIQAETQELGDSYGMDVVFATVFIQAVDKNQQRTLSNVVRRKLNDLSFTVYDYTNPKKVSVGTINILDVSMDDISDINSDFISERYNSMVNLTLEIPAQDFI